MCSKCPRWVLTEAEKNSRNCRAPEPFLHATLDYMFIFSGKWHFKMTWLLRLLQGYYTGSIRNATAVVSWVDSGISPPNFVKISSVLCHAKIICLCFFCGHCVCRQHSFTTTLCRSAVIIREQCVYSFNITCHYYLMLHYVRWIIL